MSQIRILYILRILSEETARSTSITIHQIKEKLSVQLFDETCNEQRIRSDDEHRDEPNIQLQRLLREIRVFLRRFQNHVFGWGKTYAIL